MLSGGGCTLRAFGLSRWKVGRLMTLDAIIFRTGDDVEEAFGDRLQAVLDGGTVAMRWPRLYGCPHGQGNLKFGLDNLADEATYDQFEWGF